MKNLILLLAISMLSFTASASVIIYENRAIDSGVDKTDYRASWDNQNSSIHTFSLDSFQNFRAYGSNRNQHSHLNIAFEIADPFAGLDWWFQFAPDAGWGGELYFDGNLVTRDQSNLWWGFRWDREYELITANLENVAAGHHTIDLFWAENCCNGGQSGRFSIDQGNTWLALSSENLDTFAVPEPGTIALLGFGLAGLVLARRKQK